MESRYAKSIEASKTDAFTILELLVAITILSIMLVAVFSILARVSEYGQPHRERSIHFKQLGLVSKLSDGS